MKFPNPFKRKGGDEDELEEESEEEASGDGDEDDGDLDFEGGENALSKILDKLKNRKVLIFGGAGVGVLVIGGVAAMLLLGGDNKSGISMDLDAATTGGKKMLTPPKSGGKASVTSEKHSTSADLPKAKHAAQDTKGAPHPADAKGKKPSGQPKGKPTGATGIQIASVQAAAYNKLPEIKFEKPLSTVPDPALIEQGFRGQIPKIGKDGRLPLNVYARPFSSSDSRARIALIVTGLGLSRAATTAAVRLLPGAVTLAFDSYGSNLADWAAAARDTGHESVILLPMESAAFPVRDPGPNSISSTLEEKENLRRLEVVMGSMPGFVGIMNSMGSLFVKDAIRLKPVLVAIKARGLMFIDNGRTKESMAPKVATEIGLPRAFSNITIDRDPSRAYIDRQLARLENIARKQSVSVGIFRPYPVSLEQVTAWIKTLEKKKLALGPISSMADVQFLK